MTVRTLRIYGNQRYSCMKNQRIAVCEFDAPTQLAPQNNQLMSERGIFGLKPDLRLERRGQDGENETEQPDHSTSLGDSITSSTRIKVFGTHRASSLTPSLEV